MKFADIKKLQKDEMQKKLHELTIELMKLNAQVAIGTTPKSTKQIREIKKNLARVETLRGQEFSSELAGLKRKQKKYINH
jgi:ribosomal protein L29